MTEKQKFLKELYATKIRASNHISILDNEYTIRREQDEITLFYESPTGVTWPIVTVYLTNKTFDFSICDSHILSSIKYATLLDIAVTAMAEYMHNPLKEINYAIDVDTATELRQHILEAIEQADSFPTQPEINLHFTRYSVDYIVKIADNRLRFYHENTVVLGFNLKGEPRTIVQPISNVGDSFHIEFFLDAIIGMR